MLEDYVFSRTFVARIFIINMFHLSSNIAGVYIHITLRGNVSIECPYIGSILIKELSDTTAMNRNIGVGYFVEWVN